MSRFARALAIVVTGLGLGAAGAGGAAPLQGPLRDLVEGALGALGAGEYAEALRLYEEARQLQPQSPEIPFNMGVAAYRAGDFEKAGNLFDEARLLAIDPALRARSAYNLGTTAYRKSLQGPGEQPQAGAQLDEAASELAGALERFREAIDADPADTDARANGELTHRWLKDLQKMKEQLEQQQQQNQQQQNQQQQDNQQQQQQQGERQEQQASDQGEQQDQQQQQQQQQDQEQQTGGEQQEQQSGQASQDTGEEEERQGGEARKPMSRQEAERLLQRVRDKERKRREDLARAAAAGKPPVDKDW